MSDSINPLLSSSPHAWDRLIDAVDPPSLLVVIERRMNAALKRILTAEDILQEALLHAWRDREGFEWRGIASFRRWLLTIIDHRVHDAADRGAAAKRDAGGPVVLFSALRNGGGMTTSAAAQIPGGSTTPSRMAMYREQAEVMRLAIEDLPDDVRDIVRLRLFEQCPLEEIAGSLGLGLSAVRHRFRKGSEIYLRRLRAALGSRSPSVSGDSSAGPPRESSGRQRMSDTP